MSYNKKRGVFDPNTMYNKKTKYNKYGSSVARAKAQFKSANRATDSLSFVVNCNNVFTARYDPNTQEGVACVNVWDVLQRNSNFNSLKKMYDQVKIDGINVKLSITDAITTINNINQVKNTTIYTAWDRTGLSLSQVKFYRLPVNPEVGPQVIENADFDNENVCGYKTRIGNAIVNCTGGKKTILNTFQKWNSSLYCYPSLMNEKAQYVQTGDIKQYVQGTNQTTSYNTVSDSYDQRKVNDLIIDSNPVIPFESSAVRFKPCLLVGVFNNGLDINGNITQFAAVDPIIFNGEWSISCTFRNLKGSFGNEVGNIENPDDVDPNYIIMRLNEEDLDVAMQNIQNAQRNNEEIREIVRLNPTIRGLITIPNWLNSRYVVTNQRGRSYCTSLQIMLPGYENVTPIEAGKLIPFKKSLDNGVEVVYDDTVLDTMNHIMKLAGQETDPLPEDKLVVVAPKPTKTVDGVEQQTNYQQIKAWNTGKNGGEGGAGKAMKFAEDTAMWIINHPQEAGQLVNIGLALVNGKSSNESSSSQPLQIGGNVANGQNLLEGVQSGTESTALIPVAPPEQANLIPWNEVNNNEMRDDPVDYITVDFDNDPTVINLSRNLIDFSSIVDWNL